MIAIIKTNNPVTLSYAQSVLHDAEIGCFVLDTHQSIMDGSIGAIPQRLMVIDDEEKQARAALTEAGLGDELWG